MARSAAHVFRAAIGATIATPLTMSAVGAVVFPEWFALTLFGVFTLAPPSFISSLAIASACGLVAGRARATSWQRQMLTGVALGLFAAVFWCVVLASIQNWRLSFGFGDAAPGAPASDPVQDAARAVAFLAATGAVLGAWTALIFLRLRRSDRDPPNPVTRAP